jgi:hypothetical protein
LTRTFPTAPPSTASCVVEIEAVNLQAGPFADSERAVLNGLVEGGSGVRDAVPADRVEQDELASGVEEHVRADVGSEGRPAVIGVDGNGAAGLEHGLVQLGVGTRRHLDDDVHPSRSGRTNLVRPHRSLAVRDLAA